MVLESAPSSPLEVPKAELLLEILIEYLTRRNRSSRLGQRIVLALSNASENMPGLPKIPHFRSHGRFRVGQVRLGHTGTNRETRTAQPAICRRHMPGGTPTSCENVRVKWL